MTKVYGMGPCVRYFHIEEEGWRIEAYDMNDGFWDLVEIVDDEWDARDIAGETARSFKIEQLNLL
jgi:hypothetical protein